MHLKCHSHGRWFYPCQVGALLVACKTTKLDRVLVIGEYPICKRFGSRNHKFPYKPDTSVWMGDKSRGHESCCLTRILFMNPQVWGSRNRNN